MVHWAWQYRRIALIMKKSKIAPITPRPIENPSLVSSVQLVVKMPTIIVKMIKMNPISWQISLKRRSLLIKLSFTQFIFGHKLV